MRLLIVVIALVTAAWYVVGVRQAHDTERAGAIISAPGSLNAARARSASSLLRAAALLNPDQEVNLLRAELDRKLGDLGKARSVLDQGVASEPGNALAWSQLAASSAGSPTASARALRNLRRLVPSTKPRR